MQKHHRNAFIITAICLLACGFSACTTDSDEPEPQINLCDYLTPEQINSGKYDCGSTTTCVAGDKKCNGNNILECKSDKGVNQWVQIKTCETSCSGGSCTAQPPQGKCTVGDKKCDDNNILICLESGVWALDEECPVACSNAQCTTQPQTCVVGKKKCDGNNILECKSENGVWEKVDTCSTSCSDGSCTTQPPQNKCTAGDKKCDDNNLLICLESGLWALDEECPVACSDSQCTSQPQTCVVGKKSCDGNKVIQCKSENGEWEVVDTCSTSCTNGSCASSSNPICEIGEIKCSGQHRRECIDDGGTAKWNIIETCPRTCKGSVCSDECPNICTPDKSNCSGKTLSKCQLADNGCYKWITQKTCKGYCYANSGKCAEDLPLCELTNNSSAAIIEWVDGDTVWVRPIGNGLCGEYEYDSSGNSTRVRFNIRIHGIDAPECTKAYNGYYQTCTEDTVYTNDNERFGYEAWQAAVNLLPANSNVILTCDEPNSDGTCPVDATGHRDLTYVGYTKNSASYDFSTEMARLGMAFANTSFDSSKLGQICTAQQEAINKRIGVWSLGSTVSSVLNQMGSSKRYQLRNMQSICNDAMK